MIDRRMGWFLQNWHVGWKTGIRIFRMLWVATTTSQFWRSHPSWQKVHRSWARSQVAWSLDFRRWESQTTHGSSRESGCAPVRVSGLPCWGSVQPRASTDSSGQKVGEISPRRRVGKHAGGFVWRNSGPPQPWASSGPQDSGKWDSGGARNYSSSISAGSHCSGDCRRRRTTNHRRCVGGGRSCSSTNPIGRIHDASRFTIAHMDWWEPVL